MPQNKQNERIAHKQVTTYTEVKFSKSQQMQRISKTGQSPIIPSEQEVNYVELKLGQTSHHPHRKWLVREKRKAWRMIAGILGVLCLILMMTVGVLLPKLFSSQEDQSRKSSLLPPLSSKTDECHCCLCSHNWIGFGNSCYHVSCTTKTWKESHKACAALNSHLMKIDTEEEMEILSIFGMKGWIVLKMNETSGSWLWEDGTQVRQTLLNFSERKNYSCPYINGNYIYPGDCSSQNTYICEFNI